MKVSDPVWQGDIFATVAAFLGEELPDSIAPDAGSFPNLLRGQQKPAPHREAIVMSAIRGDLGLKTIDGWKFLDSSGGGDGTSWDASNNPIPNAAGNIRGAPKQLFHQAVDLGEDNNLIATLTTDATIRSELVATTGTDLLGLLDQLRTTESSTLFPRAPDNDGDTMPNAYERSNGLDPDWPKDAETDLDGDGATNIDEFIAGTDPRDNAKSIHIVVVAREGNDVVVTWPSVLDRDYELFWSVDAATWTSASNHGGTGALLTASVDLDTIGSDGEIPTRLFVRIGVSQ